MSAKSKSKMKNLFTKFRKSTTDLSEWSKHDEKLLKAIEDDEVNKVESLVTKKGIQVTKLDPQGHTAFHRAAAHGKLEIVNIFIRQGADTNGVDVQGRSALSCAARHGRKETAERLLMVNNNHGAEDHKRQTAVHHAAMGGSMDCVRLLLNYGADVNHPDKEGRTPLYYAAQMGFTSICKELCDNGASVNYRDNEKKTPLIVASEHGNVAVCDSLIKKGANVLLTDDHGHNATWYATNGGYPDIKTLLDNAPMIASWDLGPSTQHDNRRHIRQGSQGDDVITLNGVTSDSPVMDITEGMTSEEKIQYSVVPMAELNDEVEVTGDTSIKVKRVVSSSSSVQVNYQDDDDGDDMSSTDIVPLEEMLEADSSRRAQDVFIDENSPSRGGSRRKAPPPPPQRSSSSHLDDGVQMIQQVRISPVSSLGRTPHSVEQSPVSAPADPNAVDTSFTVMPVLKVDRPQEMVPIDTLKELEEEHEMLSDEMQKVTIENRRYREHIEKLEGALHKQQVSGGDVDVQTEVTTQLAPTFLESVPSWDEKGEDLKQELNELRNSLNEEQEKNAELEYEIASLRKQLHDSDPKPESERVGDSWGDSDEELFESPSARSKNSKQTAVLRSQLHALQVENEQLKEKIQRSEVEGLYKVDTMNVSSSSLVTDLKDLSHLEAFQQAHEAEVRNLNETISKLKSEVTELTKANAAANNSEVFFRSEVKRLKTEVDLLSDNSDSDKQYLGEIKRLNEELQDINSEAESSQAQLQAEADKWKYEVEEIRSESAQSEKEYLLKIEQLESDLMEVHAAGDNEVAVEEIKVEMTSLVSSAPRPMSEKVHVKESVSEEVDKNKLYLSVANNDIMIKDEEIETLKAKLDETIDIDDKVRKVEIDKLRGEILHVHEQLKQAKEKEDIHLDEAENLRAEVSLLSNELEKTKDMEVKYESQIEKLKDEYQNLGDSYVQSSEAEDMYKIEIAKLKEDLDELHDSHVQAVDQIDIFKVQIEDLNCHVAELKEEKTAVKKVNAEIIQELDEYKKEIAHLENELVNVEKEIPDSAQNELKQLRERVVGLENEKSSLLSRVLHNDNAEAAKFLVEENEKLTQKLHNMEERYTHISSEYVALESQYQFDMEEAKKSNDKLVEEQGVKNEAYTAMQNDMVSFTKKIDELERENEELHNRQYEIPDAYKEDLENAQSRVEELEQINMQLQNRPMQEDDLFYDLQNQMAELEEENERLKSIPHHNQKQQSSDDVDSGVSAIIDENKLLKSQIQELADEHSKLLEERNDIVSKFNELQDARNYLEQELENMHAYIESMRSRSATPLGAKFHELQESRTNIEDELRRLQHNIETMRSKSGTPIPWGAMQAEINNELYEEVALLRNDNNRLNEELEKMHETLDKLEDEGEHKGQEMSQTREQTKALENLAMLNKDLQNQNDKLKTDFNRRMGEHVEKLQDLASLNTELRGKLEKLQLENERLSSEAELSEQERIIERDVERIETVEVHQHAMLHSMPMSETSKDDEQEDNNDLDDLRQAVAQLNTDNEELALENKILGNEVKQVQQRLETVQKYDVEYVDTLIAENEKLNGDLVELTETVQQKSKELTELKNRASPTMENLDMSIESGYVKQCERIEKEKLKLKEDLSIMKEFLKSQSDELTRLLAANESLADEVESLQASKAEVEEINNTLNVDIESLLSKVHNLEVEQQKEHASLEENNQLLDEYLRIQEEIKKVKDTNEKLSSEVVELHQNLSQQSEESDKRVHKLLDEQEKLVQKIKRQEKQLAMHEQKSQSSASADASEVQNLKRRCDDLTDQLSNIERQYEVVKDENYDLRKRSSPQKSHGSYLGSIKEENTRLQQQVEKLNEELSRRSVADDSLESASSSSSTVDADIKQLQRKVYNLQQDIAENERKHHEIVATYRTHLLAAVQGRMDPEVKQALLHIIKLRHSEQFYSNS